MRRLPCLLLLLLCCLPTLALAVGGSGLEEDPIAKGSWIRGPSAAPVLLIQSLSDTIVDEVFDQWGISYDHYVGPDFELLTLGGYEHVFVAMDGGSITAAGVQNAQVYATAGGNLHFLGGSSVAAYTAAVDTYLLDVDTATFSWTMVAGDPDVSVVNEGHYLAHALPASYDFVGHEASYYQLRILNDHYISTAALNGDGQKMLVSRLLGSGRFDLCINSPDEGYYANPADYAWIKQLLRNMLDVQSRLPEVLLVEAGAVSALPQVLGELGIDFDHSFGANLTLLPLGNYSHVLYAMNGGTVTEATLQAAANYAQAGGALHLFGGTALSSYVIAMNTHLVQNNTSLYTWLISAAPHSTVTSASHYLARGLPSTYTFVNSNAAYYQLRPTDPAMSVAAVNGDGVSHLFSKPLGAGRLDMFLSAVDAIYFTMPADFAWLRQLVENMLMVQAPVIRSVVDVPEDQGRQVRLTWNRALYDRVGSAEPILEYAIYRLIEESAMDLEALSPTDPEAPLAYPIGEWDFLRTVPADAELEYSTIVSTLVDSTITDGLRTSTFFVRARTATPGVYFDSEPATGYSVDNLAPNVPTGFAVAYGPTNSLSWLESLDADFRYFKVYRGETPDFVLDPESPVALTTDAAWVDPTGSFGSYYKISAVDFAGNESAAAMPETMTGITDRPVLAFALHQNFPNPFNPRTTIRFDLPSAGIVDLMVYDLSGRLVRTLARQEFLPAGRHERMWEGVDDAGRPVAAGVYFYRLSDGEKLATARMTLVK